MDVAEFVHHSGVSLRNEKCLGFGSCDTISLVTRRDALWSGGKFVGGKKQRVYKVK